MHEVSQEELCNMAQIANKRGLHARAAARLVKEAEKFSAEISICHGDMKVSARSIMGLMMLAATIGTTITICATGPDAHDAVTALSELIKRKFDEE